MFIFVHFMKIISVGQSSDGTYLETGLSSSFNHLVLMIKSSLRTG